MTNASGSRYSTQHIEWQARLEGVELASFRARALAFLIDGAIVSLLLLAPSLWSGMIGVRSGDSFELSLEYGGLVSAAVVVLYFGLSTFWGNGATIGKRALGIRVVSLVESHLSLWHSIERALGYAASSLEGGFGFLQYFKHPNHQTVHDRIAETIVVVNGSTRRTEAN
jgi:uncharacterized RDD family membrane protein YckC